MVDRPVHPDSPVEKRFRIAARLANSGSLWPWSVVIHPTDVCNHRCEWCWFDRGRNHINIPQLVELLEFLGSKGMQELVTSGGGEPLLHPQIHLLLDYLQCSGIRTRKLHTNGSLLKRFPQIATAFDYIRVSVDAGGDDAYARVHRVKPFMYHQVLDDLANLGRGVHEVAVGVSMVVTTATEHTIPILLRDCASRGIRHVVIKPLLRSKFREKAVKIDVGQIPAEVDVVLYSDTVRGVVAKNVPPEISSFSFMIGARGWVYPCCHLTDKVWQISRAERKDVESTVGSEKHLAILKAYAHEIHDCAVYNLWSPSPRSPSS